MATIGNLALALFLLSIALTCSCKSDGAATDAQALAPDACTAVLIPAIVGTIESQEGSPVVPDSIEATTEGQTSDCMVTQTASEVSYSCSEFQPEATIEELPVQPYELSVTLAAETYNFTVEVTRVDNCHVESKEFNLVLPPL